MDHMLSKLKSIKNLEQSLCLPGFIETNIKNRSMQLVKLFVYNSFDTLKYLKQGMKIFIIKFGERYLQNIKLRFDFVGSYQSQ